jgi:hypothetical protein
MVAVLPKRTKVPTRWPGRFPALCPNNTSLLERRIIRTLKHPSDAQMPAKRSIEVLILVTAKMGTRETGSAASLQLLG